jgi:hypothetical protein
VLVVFGPCRERFQRLVFGIVQLAYYLAGQWQLRVP